MGSRRWRRFSTCVCALALASAGVAGDPARGPILDSRPTPRVGERSSRGDAAPRVKDAARPAPFDPDAGSEVYLPIQRAATAGIDPDCNVIGDAIFAFAGVNRYRGNAYRVEQRAMLNEIKMELAFAVGANAELFVAIHQRQEDGSYTRYRNFDVRIQAEGEGTSTFVFYTTADAAPQMPPIELEPDFTYAIGFAWKANVTFARDAEDHPVPFEIGDVLGSVGATLPAAGDPFVPEAFPTLQIFTGGAYSMQLCFEPQVGACCDAMALPQPKCTEVFEEQCLGAGSFFHGERTKCAETVCEFGACCSPCGTCANTFTTDSCAAGGGAAFWGGVQCSGNLCPLITGACCNGTTCSLKCEPQCIAGGGTYRGDDTNCQPNMCQGACCISGGCQNRTSTNCSSPNVFKGTGTTCLGLAPGDDCGGACCRGFDIDELDTCDVEPTRTNCAYDPDNPGFPSAYRGDGTNCPFDCNSTSYGGCCLPDGMCLNTTSGFCAAPWVRGWFLGVGDGNYCDDAAAGANPCTQHLRRCCFSDGSCQLLDGRSTACTLLGGVLGTETTCSPTACASAVPTGACCETPAGTTCMVKTQAQCNAANGLYQGDTTTCVNPATTCPGFGACCRGDGDCFDDLSAAECTTIEGGYQGNGTACDAPTVDCDTRGACCTQSGACQLLTASQCAGLEGSEFQGAGSGCGANACVPGACCLTAGCETLTDAGCAARGGTYKGDNVPCAPEPCTPGACCTGEVCTDVSRAACEAGTGTFLGVDETCDAETCLPGACCATDCACQDGVQVFDCTAAGSTFVPGGVCAEAACAPRIVGSDPPNCAIDARQPHSPNSALPREGWSSLALTFTCDASGITTADFSVTVEPPGDTPVTPPTIINAAASLNTVTLTLSRVIDLQAWTCITHDASATKVCLGALPGDVNGDGTTDVIAPPQAPAQYPDLDALLNYLGGSGPPLSLWQCDANRSNHCNPADLLTVADFYFGADSFEPWLDMTMIACPTCVEETCPGGGACCLAKGCEIRTEPGCTAEGGVYQGGGVPCAPGLCTLAACCRGAACTVETQHTCELDGGVYLAAEPSCGAGTCP